jgi:hypothetical protein
MTIGIIDIATQASARLNLTRGRDNKRRGHCPACGYAKPTLEVAVGQDRIAVSCDQKASPKSRPAGDMKRARAAQ